MKTVIGERNNGVVERQKRNNGKRETAKGPTFSIRLWKTDMAALNKFSRYTGISRPNACTLALQAGLPVIAERFASVIAETKSKEQTAA